jgi:hypothetical protein
MQPVGFEPTNSAGEQQQPYYLDRAATGTGLSFLYFQLIFQGSAFIVKTSCMKIMKKFTFFCVCFDGLSNYRIFYR